MSQNIDKEIGEKLKALREKKNLSQRDVAEEVGISFSYVSKIERGEKVPTMGVFKNLCDLYGTSVASLFGEEKELPRGLKEIGVEWISFAKDMKDKELTPQQVKEIIEVVQQLRKF
ncbi:HTH-type transcriptional regulator [Bacillus phage vB_BhaS-171]|uniref:transcriptional regulator n=1 Tax=Bacillus phage vB_BhaS-171 TaxID=1775140 RepID=UPI0007449B0A|nr:transcriptional regulator [Bacillus phage vB_BhaS-171]ALY08093.1 HTH-type transcriptional regulator [Bacillus phage vB_BhaS-171]